MASVTLNTSASRSDEWQSSEAGATIQDSRVVSVFERSAPRFEFAIFFKTPHVNSHIISFLDTKEIASVIRLLNKQANRATRAALRIQLSAKTSLTYKEIVDYQDSLALEDPAAVLQFCINKKHESHLTQLDLSRWYNIDDASLGRFAAGCPNLTSLNLSLCWRIKEPGLRALAQCPNLLSLNLSGCDQLTDAMLRELALCTKLTSVNLSHCDQLTDAIIAVLPNHLTSINLSGCYRLTDGALIALAAERPNLTSLNLSRCRTYTNNGLKALAAGCHQLTSLDLSYCYRLSEVGLIALAAGCPNLSYINLAGGYTHLTDEGLIAIATGCPDLTSINLSECDQLTNEGLTALVARCPNLTTIVLADLLDRTRRVTEDRLRALHAAYPRLCIVSCSFG